MKKKIHALVGYKIAESICHLYGLPRTQRMSCDMPNPISNCNLKFLSSQMARWEVETSFYKTMQYLWCFPVCQRNRAPPNQWKWFLVSYDVTALHKCSTGWDHPWISWWIKLLITNGLTTLTTWRSPFIFTALRVIFFFNVN